MKNTDILLFIIVILSLFACKYRKLTKDVSMNKVEAPPGTIKIANNLFIDDSEISNFSYREFMYWNERIYGKNSLEYLKILPKDSVWFNLDSCYTQLDEAYLRHPVYQNFPLVGISYEQAVFYTKWRSDRVMEYLLDKYHVLLYDPNNDSGFTIENYFNGKFNDTKPNPHFLIYPHYTLPDSSTFCKAFLFADSLNARNYKPCKRKYMEENFATDCNCFENLIEKTKSHPYGNDPTQSVNCPCCRKTTINHLQGNVRELTNIPGQYFGCGFIDSCSNPKSITKQDTLKMINSYTGFRNACEYRIWKK